MVNLKLLCKKQNDAHKNIQQAQATQISNAIKFMHFSYMLYRYILCVWNSDQILLPFMFVLYPEVRNVSDLNIDC